MKSFETFSPQFEEPKVQSEQKNEQVKSLAEQQEKMISEVKKSSYRKVQKCYWQSKSPS